MKILRNKEMKMLIYQNYAKMSKNSKISLLKIKNKLIIQKKRN